MLTKRDLLRSTAAIAALAATTAKYTPAIAQNKADWPRLLEAKDIAEEGFIYGLPLVMNYAVMQEFAVDRNSGQFKAPFNEIKSLHHVATPADTAVITPNSDTPYSMLWLDLRAEPMVISVPAIEKDRYYAVQLIDGNTYNFGYIGTRATGTEAGDYLVVGPDWKGGTPSGIKKVFQSTTPFTLALIRTQLFNPGDISERRKSSGRLQGRSRFPPSLNNPPRPPRRRSISFPPPLPGSRITSSSISTQPCNSSPRRRGTRRSARSLRRLASAPARPSSSRIYRSNTKPKSWWA